MNFDVTTGVQSVTTTGAVTGSLDTSAMAGDYSLNVCVSSLTAGATAVITIEDTASGSAFSDAKTVATFKVTGQIVPQAEVFQSQRNYQFVARFGSANTAFRANVVSLTGGATLKIRSWLTQ